MNTNKMSLPVEDSKEGRDFQKLVVWASSFSIAVLAGLLASLKEVNPAILVRFDAVSAIAFVLGGVFTAIFLRIVMRSDKQRRAVLVVAAAVVSVLVYFTLAIKDTAHENRSDVTIGTAIAVAVLSCVAFVLWRLTRYLEADQAENRDDVP